MKARRRHTPREIERALRQLEEGMPVEAVCRRLGMARSTFYRWRARFTSDGDLQRRLKDENRRLRRRVRQLAEDKAMLQYILRSRDEPP